VFSWGGLLYTLLALLLLLLIWQLGRTTAERGVRSE